MNIVQFQFDFAFRDYDVFSITIYQESKDGTVKEYLSCKYNGKTGKNIKICFKILNFLAHRIKFGIFEFNCNYDIHSHTKYRLNIANLDINNQLLQRNLDGLNFDLNINYNQWAYKIPNVEYVGV